MKKISAVSALVLALAVMLSLGVGAVMYSKTSDAAEGTPKIDGELDEAYKASTKVELGANKYLYAENGGDESKAPTATAYFLHDANALYFYIDVKDPTVSGSNTTNPWECDSVELFLDYDHKATALEDEFTQNGGQMRFAAYAEKFGHPGMSFGSQEYMSWLNNDGEFRVEFKTVPKNGGYIVEAKIPYSETIKPMIKNDTMVGMNIQINDAQKNKPEDDDDNTRTGIVVWADGEGGDQSWQWAGSLENLKLLGVITQPTTTAPTTVAPATVAPTTVAPTTVAPTTVAPTTTVHTTIAPTTTAVPTTTGEVGKGNAQTSDPIVATVAMSTAAALMGWFAFRKRK